MKRKKKWLFLLKKRKIRRKRIQKIIRLKLKKRNRKVFLLRKQKSEIKLITKKRYVRKHKLSSKTRISRERNKKYKKNYLYSPKSFKNLWLFIRKDFKIMKKKRTKRSLIKKEISIKPPYG